MQAMSARSSRSHTVFPIILEQKQKLKGGNADGLQVALEYPLSTHRVPLEYRVSTPGVPLECPPPLQEISKRSVVNLVD
jgi:hypothetical protein